MGPIAEDLEGEIWKDIPGMSFYQASNFGRIRSWRKARWGRSDKPRLLSPCKLGHLGHLFVNVVEDSGRKSPRLVHRLVLFAFVGAAPTGMIACHLDGNGGNNNVINLRWDTPSGNERDKVTLGRDNRGERHGNAKLTWIEVDAIRKDTRSAIALAAMYKVSRRTVSNIRSWKSWVLR